MKLTEFDYELPQELIAQHPAEKRENAKMMVIHRDTGETRHRHFYDIVDYLRAGDCLVLNDSKVIPARLFGTKEPTGAKIEVFLVRRIREDEWECLVRPGKRLKEGDVVSFSQSPLFTGRILGEGRDGTRHVRFSYEGSFHELLDEYGNIPLPPYIERAGEEEDKSRYQTVYCHYEGSVAAPTAGLHFTRALLEALREKGVQVVFVTLHVGIGTFRPVKTEDIEGHVMHYEEYSISQQAAQTINQAKKEGRRVIAVGTTSTRTLESAAGEDGLVRPGQASTNLFIRPPHYRFKVVDGLLTNFHLPKSTLLMLISAFYDREEILKRYRLAVREGYRFFSYGDCMLLL